MADFPIDPDDHEEHNAEILLTVRPRKIAIYAAIGATAVVLVGIIVALKLRSADTGVIFRASDAMAMVGLAFLLAGGLLLTARPRLRADAEGLRIRNIVGEKFISWALIERIAFPEGSVWAQLQLADDEVMSVMAIQSMDKHRAVDALREVRALHTQYAPPRPVLAVRTAPEPPAGPPRPLGRLEQIDLMKAAEGKTKKRRPFGI